MARKIRLKLGEVLLQWKTVTQEQVTEALNLAKGTGKRIGEAFIEIQACCEEDVAKALAHQFGMEFLNLERAEDNSKIDLSLMNVLFLLVSCDIKVLMTFGKSFL